MNEEGALRELAAAESSLLECDIATQRMRELFGLPAPPKETDDDGGDDDLFAAQARRVARRARTQAADADACAGALQRLYTQAAALEARMARAKCIWRLAAAKLATLTAAQQRSCCCCDHPQKTEDGVRAAIEALWTEVECGSAAAATTTTAAAAAGGDEDELESLCANVLGSVVLLEECLQQQQQQQRATTPSSSTRKEDVAVQTGALGPQQLAEIAVAQPVFDECTVQ